MLQPSAGLSAARLGLMFSRCKPDHVQKVGVNEPQMRVVVQRDVVDQERRTCYTPRLRGFSQSFQDPEGLVDVSGRHRTVEFRRRSFL